MSKNQLSCVFILFVGGMLADLLLIEHFESAWQLVPVLFLAVAMLTFLCLKKWPALTGFFRAWMYLGMVSGIVGLFLHARNNWEFAVELYANLGGWPLLIEVATGAIPVISPGFLIPIAWFGLILSRLNQTQ